MAVLEKLRSRAGILLAVIIGLALFGFILQDLFTSGTTLSRASAMEIGRIGRHSISYMDFQQKVDDMVKIYQITGNNNLDEATQESIREQTWQRMIREEILDKEYKKLGIDVTPDELFDQVQGAQPHPMIQQIFTDPQTGIFNRAALFNFLRNMDRDQNMKTYWLFLENEIRQERKFTKYNNLISKGLYVPDIQAKRELAQRNRVVDFDYVVKRYTSIPDSLVSFSNEDVKKYYEAHKYEYKQDATRDIEYVVFDVKPSPSDIRAAEKWINDIKPDFESVEEVKQFINLNSDQPYDEKNYKDGELPATINDFMFQAKPGDVYGPYFENNAYKLARLVEINFMPDSVKARHILIQPNAQANQNTAMEQARNLADSLKTLIENGADFASLAREYSADQGSANLGGNLGWFRDGMMVQEFNDACFKGRPGEILTVETQFGVHVVEIQEQGPKVKKVKVAILARNLDPSSETYQAVYTEASRFAGTNNTYEKFDAATARDNITKRVANDIRQNDKTIPGLESPRPLIRAAFKADEGKIILDDNSQAVFEMDNKFIIAYVTKVREEGTTPLADIRSEVEFNVRKEKKAEMIREEMEKALQNASGLETLSTSLGIPVEEATGINFTSFSVPRAGLEPALIATAVETKEGQLSQPVEGNNGVYVLQVKNVTEGTVTDFSADKLRLTSSYQARASYEVFEALKKSTGVKDYRSKFF